MSKWNLDPTHSEMNFKVRHMMITNVTGSFTKFNVNLEADNDQLSNAKINFEADTNSVNTKNDQRDGHLKGPDFFDAEKFPAITFKSTGFTPSTNGEQKLKGDLTIKGVTKPVELTVEFGGIGKDPWGNTKAGFTVNGKINRTDFGLNWNAAIEAGGVLVSEEVKLHGEIQLVKQA